MIRLKLLRLCKDLETNKNLAVFWFYYDGHPMGGDGELIILEEGQTHQDSREIIHKERERHRNNKEDDNSR